MTDLTDSFEQRASRRVTRSNSNLSNPPEQYSPRVSPERAKSLDSKMTNKDGVSTPPGEIPGKSNETTPGNDSEKGKLDTEGHENGLPTESASADDTRTGDNKTGPNPSNAQLMEMLKRMNKDITESKGIKQDLNDFRTETFSSMKSLQSDIKGLGDNQKTLETMIDAMKKEQDSMASQVKDLRDGLAATNFEVAEIKKFTGANIDEIASNIKAAADRVNLDADLQNAINVANKDLVIQGYKPDLGISELEAGKKFLKDIIGKSDSEITNLELLSVSFSKADSDYPTGLLTFKSESTVGSLLRYKRKCREKGIKIKESVPLVYNQMQKKLQAQSLQEVHEGLHNLDGLRRNEI